MSHEHTESRPLSSVSQCLSITEENQTPFLSVSVTFKPQNTTVNTPKTLEPENGSVRIAPKEVQQNQTEFTGDLTCVSGLSLWAVDKVEKGEEKKDAVKNNEDMKPKVLSVSCLSCESKTTF